MSNVVLKSSASTSQYRIVIPFNLQHIQYVMTFQTFTYRKKWIRTVIGLLSTKMDGLHSWSRVMYTTYLWISEVNIAGLLKNIGDVATVLLDLVCLSLFCFFTSFQTDWMMMRSDLCVEHWLSSDSVCKQKSHWIITINVKMNVWSFKLIFPTDTLQQNI